MCGQKEETVMQTICECTTLEQKEYKRRHDLVGTAIHWELCKQLEFNHADKWYEHKPASALENEKSQLLWDFEVQTDHHIEARRPDLIIVDKEKNTCQIVDQSEQSLGIRTKIETMQATALLKTARIIRKEACCHWTFKKNPPITV